MSTYAIGDVQGCFEPLQRLLETIHFNEHNDRLWFTGDLINRGPNSLSVLRFVKQLKKTPIVVLGNHDFHLLAVYFHRLNLKKHDTIQDILAAPDVDELCHWLLQRPLLHVDDLLQFMMVHAGLPPQWTKAQAKIHAQEVEQVLQSQQAAEFLAHLYGNEPSLWDETLTGWERLRFIVNCFTRMRYCDEVGRLNLENKSATPKDSNDIPWFAHPNRATQHDRIIFGHWAALEGKANTPNVFALDTGCVWGRCLTALRLEDGHQFHVACA
jgi:bis(5'-nucleosyl)-tetraphosphatase (symmetrical)